MSYLDLIKNYLMLARDLDVMEAKLFEDIYKLYLMEVCVFLGVVVDSVCVNFVVIFVNVFVNVGFG